MIRNLCAGKCLKFSNCTKIFSLTSLNVSIFIVNNFYVVTNCLKINCVTIYRGKCLGIVTSKILRTNCFRCNSEKKSAKFPIPKMKLNRIDATFSMQVLKQNV